MLTRATIELVKAAMALPAAASSKLLKLPQTPAAAKAVKQPAATRAVISPTNAPGGSQPAGRNAQQSIGK